MAKRTPSKIVTNDDPLFGVFGGLLNSGHKITSEKLQGLDPSKISQEQIRALEQTSLALWVLNNRIEVDNRPFSFSDHRYLLPLYMDKSQEIVVMKAAQLGVTIWMLLYLLHWLIHNVGKAALMFPTERALNELSKDRMSAIIRSNPDLQRAVHETDTLGFKKIGPKSSLYMRHMGGVASKDSVPLDVICFDEVRLVNQSDVDQVRERVSHSSYKKIIQASTAGMPDSDIAGQFMLGTQNYFHSRCLCVDGVVLSDVFPECIVEHKGEVYYRCPRCKARIDDPQNGRYVPHNPGARVQSYHMHQMLSKYISPLEIWTAFNKTSNIKEFYNAKLGKPYIDEDSRPVIDDDLTSCENTDILWKDKDNHCAMGVDQMGGYNYVVVAKRGPSGKKQIVHFEIIDSSNPIYVENGNKVTPFRRLYPLMKEYDVDLCIIDGQPNFNEALEFARAFPGRVFVAQYIEGSHDMVQWGDRSKYKVTVKKGSNQIKFKHTAILNRFQSLDFMFDEIKSRSFEWPNPKALIQQVKHPKTGKYEPMHIWLDFGYKHLKALVKQRVIQNDMTGQSRMEFQMLGCDPHTCHALNYANIALERMRQAPSFVMM
jgi:hypothetical protein